MMKRDIQEVVLSQHKMLVREGKTNADTYPVKMEQTFRKAYQTARGYAASKPFIQFLELDYLSVLQDPEGSAKNVAAFLGTELDVPAMASQVDTDLYRNRMNKDG